VLLVYYIVPRRGRNIFLFFINLVFYGWGEPMLVLLMLVSILINYAGGYFVEKFRNDKGKARISLAVTCVLDIGILGFFKYTPLIVTTLNSILPLNIPVPEIALPIGISFYTFQTMSYVIDVYRDDAPVSKSLINFGTYVALFPQLIAGPIVRYKDVAYQLSHREETLEQFRGEILQVPPMYSALKVNGQKLCDLARKGKEVERQPRPITIHELTLLGMDAEGIHLRVRCSKGTYIRTLCKDIGEALGCGGCMAALRRVEAGEYTQTEAVPLQVLLETENPEQYLRPVDSMFANHPAVTLSEKQTLRCRNGNSFSTKLEEGTYRVYAQNGEFLALSQVHGGVMSTIKSFWEV
jgi:hypothetical protein